MSELVWSSKPSTPSAVITSAKSHVPGVRKIESLGNVAHSSILHDRAEKSSEIYCFNGQKGECNILVEGAREPVGDCRTRDLLEKEAEVVKQVGAPAVSTLAWDNTAGVWRGTHCDIDGKVLQQKCMFC